ncbi:hypothetical protein OG264_05695 [Streptomyces xanthophaeus]|uniref:hypothetical protein n=1 Tax=Streptomyces xanthophaeus TaxID=67385 RepID=UPI003864A516|nr:hypothetical protein OG264_05695 [Streptomyces xanthophaeus]WST63980.1 hypothetical protein OG605_32665 [Streptomyces xanthophaeus]
MYRKAAVLAVTLAAFTVSCDAEPSASPGSSASAPASQGVPEPASTPSATGSPTASLPDPENLPPEKVRDSFAGLQATLDDACTPGNCAYFLGRVYDELHRLDRSMKADPKGPGHFPEPIALIAKLDKELGGDRTFENLKKHQTSLIGTRDKINTWMQGHPDDYR